MLERLRHEGVVRVGTGVLFEGVWQDRMSRWTWLFLSILLRLDNLQDQHRRLETPVTCQEHRTLCNKRNESVAFTDQPINRPRMCTSRLLGHPTKPQVYFPVMLPIIEIATHLSGQCFVAHLDIGASWHWQIEVKLVQMNRGNW